MPDELSIDAIRKSRQAIFKNEQWRIWVLSWALFFPLFQANAELAKIFDERLKIELVMLDGREHDFFLDDIESWGAMDHSLMPVGLPQTMAIEEFRDLLAFLESLR